jgi:hypothetical protein
MTVNVRKRRRKISKGKSKKVTSAFVPTEAEDKKSLTNIKDFYGGWLKAQLPSNVIRNRPERKQSEKNQRKKFEDVIGKKKTDRMYKHDEKYFKKKK